MRLHQVACAVRLRGVGVFGGVLMQRSGGGGRPAPGLLGLSALTAHELIVFMAYCCTVR